MKHLKSLNKITTEIPLTSDVSKEFIEQIFSFGWTSLCFWMELNAEERLGLVADTLVSLVVSVNEERFPVLRQSLGLESETVILTGKMTAASQ